MSRVGHLSYGYTTWKKTLSLTQREKSFPILTSQEQGTEYVVVYLLFKKKSSIVFNIFLAFDINKLISLRILSTLQGK